MDGRSRPRAAATPEDGERLRSWAGGWFEGPESLPLSFTCDGRTVRGLPASWGPVRRVREEPGRTLVDFEGRDATSGLALRVECVLYRDHPAVEWTGWLRFEGGGASPLVEDLRALDAGFAGSGARLWHCNGDFCSPEGYAPDETPLAEGTALRFSPRGGRPCDGAFPYFRLGFDGGGLALAVGWPAQWAAAFSGEAGRVRVRAGQETTRFRLRPGEVARTPRMAILAWDGAPDRAANLWRRWYLDHVLPRPDGRPLGPRLACSCNDGGEEYTQATEENQLRFMRRFEERGLDYDVWWIDAGWYPCRDGRGERHWWNTGTWEPDPERFPSGLAPIAEHAAGRGAELLLWFEPERVVRGSRLDVEHPEWLLRAAAGGGAGADGDGWEANRLLDLGNDACRRWLTGHVSSLVRREGVRVYRQDFNFEPLRHWRENEADDRRGMLENLHVQGYLRFWDDLLAQNPGLWIDSCASGGRRNDLETMRRSVPLHYSDYGYGLHAAKLGFQQTLSAWIPYFKDTALSWDSLGPGGDRWFQQDADSFAFHCALAPMLALAVDIRRDDQDLGVTRRMVDLWRRAADLVLRGDAYALTPWSADPRRWVVRQFDRPEEGRGLVQGIRLPGCAEGEVAVRLRGLRPDGLYVFENGESGERRRLSGEDLAAAGFVFRLPERAAELWFYRAAE